MRPFAIPFSLNANANTRTTRTSRDLLGTVWLDSITIIPEVTASPPAQCLTLRFVPVNIVEDSVSNDAPVVGVLALDTQLTNIDGRPQGIEFQGGTDNPFRLGVYYGAPKKIIFLALYYFNLIGVAHSVVGVVNGMEDVNEKELACLLAYK